MDLATIVIGIVCSVVAAQLYDWIPALSRWLIKLSTARLSQEKGDRYQEEWLAHLNECSSKFGMISHSLGCFVAGSRMAVPWARYKQFVNFPLVWCIEVGGSWYCTWRGRQISQKILKRLESKPEPRDFDRWLENEPDIQQDVDSWLELVLRLSTLQVLRQRAKKTKLGRGNALRPPDE